jgi:hypothetical protein
MAVLTVDLMYANFHIWANLPYTVRVPRLGSTFTVQPQTISQLLPRFCDGLIASQAAYWLPNKYLPYTLSENLTLIDGEAGFETGQLPLTPLSSVKIGTRCKEAWVAIPVVNMTRDPILIQLPIGNVTAENIHSPMRSMRCPFVGRTATLEATCDYGPTRSTTAQVSRHEQSELRVVHRHAYRCGTFASHRVRSICAINDCLTGVLRRAIGLCKLPLPVARQMCILEYERKRLGQPWLRDADRGWRGVDLHVQPSDELCGGAGHRAVCERTAPVRRRVEEGGTAAHACFYAES